MGKLEEVRNLLLRSGVHSPLDYAEELSTKEATELAKQICKLFEQPIEGPMSQEDFLRRWRTNASNL